MLLDFHPKDQKDAEEGVVALLGLDCDAEDFVDAQLLPFLRNHWHPVAFATNEWHNQIALVQFAVKLFFLSQGDDRYASLFPDHWEVDKDGSSFFEVNIQGGGVFFLADGSTWYDVLSIACVEPVPIVGGRCRVAIYALDVAKPTLEDKVYVAAMLFCALANQRKTKAFRIAGGAPDSIGAKIECKDKVTPLDVAIDMLMDGKIRPCGHCSKPVYTPRKNSMQFCNKSCQQRYRESAMRAVKAGVPLAQTARAFPLINPATIRGWYYSPEMLTI